MPSLNVLLQPGGLIASGQLTLAAYATNTHSVNKVDVNNPGSGYTPNSALAVTFSLGTYTVAAVATAFVDGDGKVAYVQVFNPGVGTVDYTGATVAAPGGGGTQATLTITIGANSIRLPALACRAVKFKADSGNGTNRLYIGGLGVLARNGASAYLVGAELSASEDSGFISTSSGSNIWITASGAATAYYLVVG